MISTAFYERRSMSLEIDFNDRRLAHRRKHEQVISLEQRRLASQVRRHERQAFKIPIQLQMEEKVVSGCTHDISPEGLLLFTDAALSAGIPMTLQFSFGRNVCYLNISGQTVFCLSADNGTSGKHAIGIRFSGIREWEQTILISAVQELKQNFSTHENSLLKVLVSKDTLAMEAANFYTRTPRTLGKKPGTTKRTRFTFNKTIYLTDTNALGNAYFARYFDWQGMAREEFLRHIIPNPLDFFRSGMRIVTLNATMDYKAELGLYDEIEIEVRTSGIKRTSFELIFYLRSKKTSALVAVGTQRLAFFGKNNRFIPIPPEFKKRGYAYLVDDLKEKPKHGHDL